MVYNPVAYWTKRGRDYRDPPPKLEGKGEIGNLLSWMLDLKPASVLEVGSGWGRIFLALREASLSPPVFRMCDFVNSMRVGCGKRTGVTPDIWDGRSLPYEDSAYDLVISFSVLLHVRPENLERVFAEHSRVSNRHLFVATCTEARRPLAPHCFLHDYESLFQHHQVLRTKTYSGEGWTRRHWLLEKC